jgi:hypothetical protein
MKLNLIFIVMDLFTILAYPFVFMYGKLLKFSKVIASIRLTSALAAGSIVPGE